MDTSLSARSHRWHVTFERIHPFEDGNGRTGRLLYFWHCTRVLDKEPILWRADDAECYYALFDSPVDPHPNSDRSD